MTIATDPKTTIQPPTSAENVLVADPAFARLPSPDTIAHVADVLRAKGYDVHVAPDREAARRIILDLIPEGAEVGQGSSQTLEQLGITGEIETSGRYDAIRPKTRAMDRKTQMREIRKLTASPEFWLNSVHALTEDGTFLIASNTGSQLGPISAGAGRVILAIGAQKIVPDLQTAFRRIREYSYPLEDARMSAAYGIHSAISKILVMYREPRPGRVSIVLVEEPVGE